MTLLDRSRDLRERLVAAGRTESDLAELATLQARRDEWRLKTVLRDQIAMRWQVLADTIGLAGDPVDVRRDTADGLAGEAAQLLGSGAPVQSLSDDNLWSRLLKSADAASKAADSALLEAWQRWVAALGAVETPQSLRARIPHSRENLRLLGRYETEHKEFVLLTSGPSPSESEVLDTVTAIVGVLAALRRDMVIDAPDEVLAFLRAVEDGSATLGLVTTTILDWLRKHDRLDRFRVGLGP